MQWLEDLDKQLMLTMQSVCNMEGIRIPWNKVAEYMGGNVTEGAIVQHLAKTRNKMQEAGAPVPPALKRGGTAPTSKIFGAGSNKRKPTVGGRDLRTQKTTRVSNEDEEDDFDVDNASDPDEDYVATKNRRKSGGSAKVKKEDSDGEADGIENLEQENSAKKSKGSVKKGNAAIKEEQSPTATRGRRSSVNYAKLDKGEDSDFEGDSDDSLVGKKEYVGAGAPFLDFPKDNKAGTHTDGGSKDGTPSSTPHKGKVVALQGSFANMEQGGQHGTSDSSDGSGSHDETILPDAEDVRQSIGRGGNVTGTMVHQSYGLLDGGFHDTPFEHGGSGNFFHQGPAPVSPPSQAFGPGTPMIIDIPTSQSFHPFSNHGNGFAANGFQFQHPQDTYFPSPHNTVFTGTPGFPTYSAGYVGISPVLPSSTTTRSNSMGSTNLPYGAGYSSSSMAPYSHGSILDNDDYAGELGTRHLEDRKM